MATGAAGPRGCSLFAACRGLFGVLAAHGTGTLALTGCSKVRFAFALLLSGSTLGLLSPGAGQVAPVAAFALIFRRTGFLKGDCYCLTAALDWSAFAAAATLQFSVLELMHHAPGDALLPG
jgi:hypothetical protein